MLERRSDRSSFRRGLTAVLAVILIVLLVGGTWFYRAEEQRVQAGVEQELTAIEKLKVAEIERWRVDRTAEAEVIAGDPVVGGLLANVASGGRSGDATPVVEWIERTAARLEYTAIVVVDSNAAVVEKVGNAHIDFDESVSAQIQAVLFGSAPMLTDLHRASGDEHVHIGAIAPVLDPADPAAAPIGAVVTQIDANEFLYPLVQSWPVPSETAETLLVTRDGNDALFLNELRHVDGAALELRESLDRENVPAVMAVNGVTGVVEGVDYRDEPVVAVIEPVSDSPWYMIAKVDASEAFAARRNRAISIVAGMLGLAFAAWAAVALLWQRSHAQELQALLAAERAAREGEARFEATLLSVGDGVVVTDAEGRVTLLNPVAEELTGWSAGEARGRPVEEIFRIVNEDSREPVESPVRAVCRDGRIVGLANHTVLLSRDGQERPIADSGAPIRGDDGSLVGVVLVFRDQTQERAARNALARTNEALERAEEHALLGSWEFTPSTGEGWWSAQMYRLLGMDPHAGMPSYDEYVAHVHPDDRGGVRRALEDMDAAREPVAHPFRSDPSRGPVRVLSPTVHVECDERGDVVRLTGTILDVTDFHEAQQEVVRLNESLEHTVEERTEELMAATEELQSANEELITTNEELQTSAEEVISINERLTEASEAKTRFLRAMSHELRTPLNSIIGFSDIMYRGLAGDVTDEQHRQLEMINHAGTHLLSLINDILDLSKIEAGKVDICVEPVDAEALGSSVVDAVSGHAKAKGLGLEFAASGGPLQIETDRRRLEQILLNLLGNAVKFTETGGVRLTVGPSGVGLISFKVSDTGPGISPHDQERIFGEFAQVELNHDAAHEGTGLGLAISRGLAQVLGGSITLSSRVGVGSTFTLVVPVRRLED